MRTQTMAAIDHEVSQPSTPTDSFFSQRRSDGCVVRGGPCLRARASQPARLAHIVRSKSMRHRKSVRCVKALVHMDFHKQLRKSTYTSSEIDTHASQAARPPWATPRSRLNSRRLGVSMRPRPAYTPSSADEHSLFELPLPTNETMQTGKLLFRG